MTITAIVTLIAAVVGPVLSLIFGSKAAAAQTFFKVGVTAAAQIADAIAPSTKNTWDDKAAAFLKALAGIYEAHGQTLSDVDAAKATEVFKQMNGVK